MRRRAFIVVVLGMFILALMLNFNVKEINNYDDLKKLEINQKVFLRGKVVSERAIVKGKLFVLDNEIELVCECLENLVDKEIEVEGAVSEFDEKKQVSVLKILVLDDD